MSYYFTDSGAARWGRRVGEAIPDQLSGGGLPGTVSGQAWWNRLEREGYITQNLSDPADIQSEEAAEQAAARRNQQIQGTIRQAFAGADTTSYIAQAFGSGRRGTGLGANQSGGVASMVQRYMEGGT